MNTPVSFEIAKLLNKNKCYILSNDRYNKKGTFTYSKAWSISAPTITEVIMWILENHKIWISVDCGKEFWMFRIRFTDNTKIIDFQLPDGLQSALTGLIFSNTKYLKFNTPTEAYLAGIEYVLTDLINLK